MLRFSSLMPKVTMNHLDTLDEFRSFSQATASVIILELIDLIALEDEDELEKKEEIMSWHLQVHISQAAVKMKSLSWRGE